MAGAGHDLEIHQEYFDFEADSVVGVEVVVEVVVEVEVETEPSAVA